jgi:hypothetical protein
MAFWKRQHGACSGVACIAAGEAHRFGVRHRAAVIPPAFAMVDHLIVNASGDGLIQASQLCLRWAIDQQMLSIPSPVTFVIAADYA